MKVDSKGRVVIPARVRRDLKIRGAVKARVEEGRIVLEPLEDPVEELAKQVVEGTFDVEREIRELRKIAQRRLLEED